MKTEAALFKAANDASRRSDEWSARHVGRTISSNQWLDAMLLEEEAADAWRAYAAFEQRRGRKSFAEDARNTANLHDALAEAAREQVSRADNPKGRKMATKKPSAAQIAARERFAELARSGAFKRKKNPLTRVKRGSPSMATGEAPSARLKKRRAKTAAAPKGFYANPLLRVPLSNRKAAADSWAPDTVQTWNDYFQVQWRKSDESKWSGLAIFPKGKRAEAEQYARAYHRAHPEFWVRIVRPD